MAKKFSRLTLALMFFFVAHMSVFSQPTFKDSTEVYRYWAKRAIIEVVYAYMQNWASTSPSNQGYLESIQLYRQVFIENIDGKNLKEINGKFSELSKFLIDNNWEETERKLLAPLDSSLKINKPLTVDFFSISENLDTLHLQTARKAIRSYDSTLAKLTIVPNKLPRPDTSHKQLFLSRLYRLAGMALVQFIVIFLAGILVGFLIANFFIAGRINAFLNHESSDFNSEFSETSDKSIALLNVLSLLQFYRDRRDHYKGKVQKLERELSIKRYDLLKEKQYAISIPSVGPREIQPVVTSIAEEKTTKAYFTIPSPDGTFNVSIGKDAQETISMYCIETSNKTEPVGFFISGAFDKRAIENLDYYLMPVCDIQNVNDRQHAMKIVMIEPGLFYQSGDVWKVIKKIKVKLV